MNRATALLIHLAFLAPILVMVLLGAAIVWHSFLYASAPEWIFHDSLGRFFISFALAFVSLWHSQELLRPEWRSTCTSLARYAALGGALALAFGVQQASIELWRMHDRIQHAGTFEESTRLDYIGARSITLALILGASVIALRGARPEPAGPPPVKLWLLGLIAATWTIRFSQFTLAGSLLGIALALLALGALLVDARRALEGAASNGVQSGRFLASATHLLSVWVLLQGEVTALLIAVNDARLP